MGNRGKSITKVSTFHPNEASQYEHRRDIDKDLDNVFMVLREFPNVGRIAKGSDYTALNSDYVIGITSTASARTVTLPKASKIKQGQMVIVKDESGAAGTNNITVDGDGSETIDGSATKVISSNYGVLRIYSNGSNWFTV